MGISKIIWGFLVSAFVLTISSNIQAAQIQTYILDPQNSWIQDADTVEIIPRAEDFGSSISHSYQFDAIYHPGQRISLSGSVGIVQDLYFPGSRTVELDIAPVTLLPTGRQFGFADEHSDIIESSLFPGGSFLPGSGWICACIVWGDPFAPTVESTIDEQMLSLYYRENNLTIAYGDSVNWLSEPPGDSANYNISFNIQASPVPLPPAIYLFLSAIVAVMTLKRKRAGL